VHIGASQPSDVTDDPAECNVRPLHTASLLVGSTKALPHRRAKLSVQQTLDAAVLKN